MSGAELSQDARLVLGVLKDDPGVTTIEGLDGSRMMLQEIGSAEIHDALGELEAHGFVVRQGPTWSLTREGLLRAA